MRSVRPRPREVATRVSFSPRQTRSIRRQCGPHFGIELTNIFGTPMVAGLLEYWWHPAEPGRGKTACSRSDFWWWAKPLCNFCQQRGKVRALAGRRHGRAAVWFDGVQIWRCSSRDTVLLTSGWARTAAMAAPALAPGLARKVKKAQECMAIRADNEDLLNALQALSDVYPENSTDARRRLKVTVERSIIATNDAFVEDTRALVHVRTARPATATSAARPRSVPPASARACWHAQRGDSRAPACRAAK